MENDIRFRVTNYFELSQEDREALIVELSEFYYEKWINTDTNEKFEFTIGELIFRLDLEKQFALKTEEYHRVEIYQKLGKVFYKLYENYLENGL
jgi:hypothetical protein